MTTLLLIEHAVVAGLRTERSPERAVSKAHCVKIKPQTAALGKGRVLRFMSEQAKGTTDEIQSLIRARIENLRPKLLDLSRRNPLISTKFSIRSNAHIRIVDELPDVISFHLGNEQRMRLVPLPPLTQDPKDEQTRGFQNALANARLTDEAYLAAVENSEPNSDTALNQDRELERALRDRVRIELGMPPRQISTDVSLPQHAKNNGIAPSYELPEPANEHEDGRHADTDIQTLLLPEDLERKTNGLIAKCRSWTQETGLNVLHASFGFLEWSEPTSGEISLAPLILRPVEISKKKTREGPEFWVKGTGEDAELNLVLAEKLQLEFGIELPEFEGGSVEGYLKEVSDLAPTSVQWKVRRQIAFGVFPSARMAMYHDLDTTEGAFEQNDVLTKVFGGSDDSSSSPFADEYEVDLPEIEGKVPFLVMDADSSQFSTIVDIADGRNLAVEGPPGTGKSQTIVNVIANSLAAGRKVLFVAEKLAALNVVKSRLEAIGLGEFILPLQADRSTRENVITSIRDRVLMTVDRDSRDYKAKTEEFKKIRSELGTYIGVMSAPFGETEFTVYDIIGNSIATNDLLSGKPKSLLTRQIENIKSYGKSRIEGLKSLGEAVEAAWHNVNAAQPYWFGLKVLSINKFVVEEICDLASSASKSFKEAFEARQKLVEFNMGTRLSLPALKEIVSVLEVLDRKSPNLNPALVRRLCFGNQLQEVANFLDNCRRLRAIQDELSQIFLDVSDRTWCDRLRSIHALCESQEIDTLDVDILSSWRQEAGVHLEVLRGAKRELGSFIEALPESGEWPIGVLRKARELVSQTPREVLAIRSEATASPEAGAIIKWAGGEGRKLLQRRSELEKIMSVAWEISIEELKGHATKIRTAGVLGVFSSTYRLSKRTYRALSRRTSFSRDVAVEDLRFLIELKEMECNLLSNQQVSAVFGIQFRGVETDFDLFDRLTDYYERIERRFAGGSNRAVRKLLKTGDLELLLSIPAIDPGVVEGTIPELFAEVDRLEERLSSFDAALEKLATLTVGLKKPAETSISALPELAGLMGKQFRLNDTLNSSPSVKDILGGSFKGGATDYAALGCDIAAAERILSLREHVEPVLGALEARTLDAARSTISAVIVKDTDASAALDQLCTRTGIDCAHFTEDRDHAEIADTLLAASSDTEGLQIHSRYAAARSDMAKEGFDWFPQTLLEENASLDNLGAIVEAVLVRAQAREVYQRCGDVLSHFPAGKLGYLRSHLAALDREIIASSRKQLRRKVYAAAHPQRGVGSGKKSTWTGMALIDNELNKKKRYLPVRELTKRAGNALLELKPCWMMSPLAVAQYIPKGTLKFDLTIIDEASQMPPEDSVGALARSHQALVVGDTNQLPPTSFFRKMIEEEDADEDESVLDESILEMANAAFRPARRLRWHYRSRHSALIKFSNHLVYDDDLIVFPSATETRPDMGVSLKLVQGRYHAGTNVEEATCMIDAALDFMRTNPDRSLGIVTLNQKQRDLLQEEMQYALDRDSKATRYVEQWSERNDGLEAFFIKNLENVQGDERDVIFIGTVYGPEKIGGPVMQRFGPINGVAGRRRLNVLFSRAKEQIVTFSSMTSSDIRADENSNPGTYMLKRWLEYAATGVLQTGERTKREPDSNFEIYVAEQIRSMGCEAVPQVGVAGYFIDIGIRHPQWPHGFIMAVECDGVTYHSSKSARDRDRLRQEVLEGLGWFFHRIWSVDWFNDPRKEAQKLREAIEKRLEYLKDTGIVPYPPSSIAGAGEPSLSDDRLADESGQARIDPDRHVAEPDLLGAADVDADRASRLPVEGSTFISIGDRVRIRYLSGTQASIEVTISDAVNNPDRGLVHSQAPLGDALLGAEEGDEIDVLVGSYVRRAVVEKVVKCSAKSNSA